MGDNDSIVDVTRDTAQGTVAPGRKSLKERLSLMRAVSGESMPDLAPADTKDLLSSETAGDVAPSPMHITRGYTEHCRLLQLVPHPAALVFLRCRRPALRPEVTWLATGWYRFSDADMYALCSFILDGPYEAAGHARPFEPMQLPISRVGITF